MKQEQSTVDIQEINQFAGHKNQWWDPNGPLRTLHEINETRLEFIKQKVDLSGLSVLDVGCGGGILTEALARSGAHLCAIDAEVNAIDIAKAHAKEQELSIDYQCIPIEEYDHSSFDVITCMELLEHVNNPQLLLSHCHRLLKPGGYLFLSTINRTIKAYLTAVVAAEYIFQILPRQTHDYSKFIKPSELTAMMRPLNFNLVDLKGLKYQPFLRTAALSSDVQINYLMVWKK